MSRYYHPELGRFISKDKYLGLVDNPASQNLYIYTENNPVNAIDPDGLWSKTISINKYLAAGSLIDGTVKGSVTNWGRQASTDINVHYRMTVGGLGFVAGTTVSGGMIAKKAAEWLVKNTFSKEILTKIFGATIGGLVFNKVVKEVTNAAKSIFSWMDNIYMQLPYTSYVIDEDWFYFSKGYSI